MGRRKITITVVDKLGPGGCHHGHRIGDTFDFDRDRGRLCPMAVHVLFPYIDILRYGGTVPAGRHGDIRVSCPDADVVNVFRLDAEAEE
jgi:uncharacterized repeat protein (TIGR04076 family)